MSSNTGIAWTDATFNPWLGCTNVSPGCDNCYAETLMDTRYHRVKWGAGQPRVRTSVANWKQPERWNRTPFYECAACGWRGNDESEHPKGHGASLALFPARRRVFCASLADVFDNEVDPAWRFDLFKLISYTPQLDWLLLTKRIGNAGRMLKDHWAGNLPAHLWLGATVVNQGEADRDIPKLLAIPAAVRFLSIEPMLGRIDLCETFGMWWNSTMQCFEGVGSGPINRNRVTHKAEVLPGGVLAFERAIDWVIVGGESGPSARPAHPAWFRSLRDQCGAAGVPFFFKQWGEWSPHSPRAGGDLGGDVRSGRVRVVHPSGRSDEEIFEASGGRNSEPGTHYVTRVGTKRAGNTLDGKVHQEWPR